MLHEGGMLFVCLRIHERHANAKNGFICGVEAKRGKKMWDKDLAKVNEGFTACATWLFAEGKKSEVQMRYVSDTRPKTAFVRELRDNHTTTQERYKKEYVPHGEAFQRSFQGLDKAFEEALKDF